jgi:TRAP-type mannitol/chloroaromatic compound transport system permease small subunit
MRIVIKAVEWLTNIVGNLGAWVMVPLVLSMVYEVVARHVFGAPTVWAYELGYMLAGSSYMFGIAYCLKQGAHIRVDFIYGQLSQKGLYDYAVEAYEYGEVSGESAWNPVVWPFRAVWVIGFFVFTLQVVAEVLKCVLILMGKSPDGAGTKTDGLEI